MRISLWGEFDNHDVVVSANVDEVGDDRHCHRLPHHDHRCTHDHLYHQVMSRSALQTLRWCDLAGAGPYTGALWMPMGRLDRALR